MLSGAERKDYLKKGVAAFRERSNPEEVNLTRIAFLTAFSSGQPITVLSTQDAVDDSEEDDPRPDNWKERFLGLALDSILFGHLPVSDAGEILPDAELPPQIMTAGGTSLATSVENGRLCLTDPYGAKATIQGVVCRLPTHVHCVMDRALMEKAWEGDDPLPSSTLERLQGLMLPQPLSLSRLGQWDEFSGRSRKDSRRFQIRSRVANPQMREFALHNQLFKVSCTVPEDQLNADRMPMSMTDLNRFEDELLLQLAARGPRTVQIAAVTKNGSYDLFYSAEHNGALSAALKAVGDPPFPVRKTRVTGDVALLLFMLTPPEKRAESTGFKELVGMLLGSLFRVPRKWAKALKRGD